MLRSMTSAIAAEVIPTLKGEHLAVMPGIIYRRDVTDKTHVGEPHQVDIWLISEQKKLTRKDLLQLIDLIIKSTVNLPYRVNEVEHPYTMNGLEIEVLYKGKWLEIGECGECIPGHLIPENYTGLASGWGLDRLAMIMKDIDDIRLLRHSDRRIASQMENLERYKPVSNQPSIKRDISIATNKKNSVEDISEQILGSLNRKERSLVQSIEIISETDYQSLPLLAVKRLRMKPEQKNILIRIQLQSLTSSLTNQQANQIREKIYKKLIKNNYKKEV